MEHTHITPKLHQHPRRHPTGNVSRPLLPRQNANSRTETLTVEQVIEIYRKRFNTLYPFRKNAITLLARMSRGIFRRFLRYLTLTLDLWESKYQETQPTIDI